MGDPSVPVLTVTVLALQLCCSVSVASLSASGDLADTAVQGMALVRKVIAHL